MADKLARVKARFVSEGVSIAEWARVRGFNVLTVYRVLSGKSKAVRGESHQIAVALGLNDTPKTLKFRDAVDAA